MLSHLRKLADHFLRRSDTAAAFDRQRFIYIKIPGDIQPLERGTRFEDPLQKLLAASGLGSVTGGGSQMDDPYPDGRPRVEFCGIDLYVTDTDRALAFLRNELPKLDAPAGTELHYTVDAAALLDRRQTDDWHLGLVRTYLHPSYGV
jgi:hypothetical protein